LRGHLNKHDVRQEQAMLLRAFHLVQSARALRTGDMRWPQRFRAKWQPVRVKKTRQTKT